MESTCARLARTCTTATTSKTARTVINSQLIPAAPFDRDFHLLVNLAVGGVGPGVDLDPAAVPGEMVVDYIRVYECNYATGDGTGCNTYA
jgi:hypothetical protein